MTRRLRQVLTACASAAALAAAGAAPALAADHGAGARFHATADFAPSVVGDASCGPTGLHIVASGTVQGTHVGTGTWSQNECVNIVVAPPDVHIQVAGEGLITAANGDQLVIDYAGTSSVPDAQGQIHVTGTYTVAGGTGRFAGATGSGSLDVTGTVGVAETAVFDGTIVVGNG